MLCAISFTAFWNLLSILWFSSDLEDNWNCWHNDPLFSNRWVSTMKARTVIRNYLVSKTFWSKFLIASSLLFLFHKPFSEFWFNAEGKGCFYCSDFGRGKSCFTVFLQKFNESALIILKGLQLRRVRLSFIFVTCSVKLRILCTFPELFVEMTLHLNCNSQHLPALNLSSSGHTKWKGLWS